MNELIPITAALADPGRLRILSCLRPGELCACHIIELLGLAPSTISKHMAILRQAGLVLARKEGRWMHYRLPGDEAPVVVRETLAWLWRCLDGDATAAADAKRLRAIVKLDPEVLCCGQRESGPGTVVPLAVVGSACCSSAPGTPAGARSRKGGRGT